MATVDDVDELIERFHLVQGGVFKGNPETVKKLWEHGEDVSHANPYGPPARGWDEVAKTIEHASALRRDGEFLGSEEIAKNVTAELAYVVAIERAKAKIGASEEITTYALRATNIFRL